MIIEGTLEGPRVINRPRGDACDVDKEYDNVDKEEDSAENALAIECERTPAYEDCHSSGAHVDREAATGLTRHLNQMGKKRGNDQLTSTSTIDF